MTAEPRSPRPRHPASRARRIAAAASAAAFVATGSAVALARDDGSAAGPEVVWDRQPVGAEYPEGGHVRPDDDAYGRGEAGEAEEWGEHEEREERERWGATPGDAGFDGGYPYAHSESHAS